MKKRFRPVMFGILIIMLAITVNESFNFTEIKNRMFPNTTFKKEVIEKIENKEISSLVLMEWTGGKDVVTLKNRADIDYILDSLAPLKLKKVSKLPVTSKETYNIIIKDQGKDLFSFLYGSDHMIITDSIKRSIQRYEIENESDLNKIMSFLENEK